MNGKTFIHVVLLLAMVFSQMATNAHMIEHLGDAPADSQSVIVEHGDHYHEHISIAQKADATETERDCFIYHSYAGANGLAPVPCNDLALKTNSNLFNQPLVAILIAQAATTHPIRGPPSILIS